MNLNRWLQVATERVLQAYPNPITNGIANVKLSHFKPNEPVSIYVFDMTGKKLKTNKAQVDEKGSLSTKFELEQRGVINSTSLGPYTNPVTSMPKL
ncbi:T9SS type A sorting domain-containing protein [Mucilaginibacter sp. P25]|uniref:T9SS type A sorting domain-containing protein n=1 Tax=Mucilaginibacter sp. P25 TaxID=3423945 RepID=UPI003D7A3B1F